MIRMIRMIRDDDSGVSGQEFRFTICTDELGKSVSSVWSANTEWITERLDVLVRRAKKLFRNSMKLSASGGSFFPRLLIRLNSTSATGLISRLITTFRFLHACKM